MHCCIRCDSDHPNSTCILHAFIFCGQDLARSQNIKRIPSYQCYWEGKKADSYEGGTPDQLNEFIARNIKEYSSSGGPLALALKLAAAAAIVAGGTFLAVRYSSGKEDETSIDAGGEILELKKRIMVAQGRLRVMEKANRGKQARAQRKLIEQLNAQVRLLERKDQATGKAGSAGTAGGGTQGKGGAAGAGAGRGAAAAAGSNTRRGRRELSIEDLARLRRRKARGDVLYSDEEDTLAADEASGAW